MVTTTMLDREGRQYHLRLRRGDVGRYVLLPGDPERVPIIASLLDEARPVARHREYNTYTGSLLGEPVSVVSTGIGGPSTAIAVEELVAIGADTFVRVGSAGAVQDFVAEGDLVIATGAVRDEGTSQQYMPLAFPALADLEVTLALRDAARRLDVRHHLGPVHSKDSFYSEVSPDRMPIAPRLRDNWRAWREGGVLCSEMESATIFVLASVLKARAGGLMVVIGNHVHLDNLLKVAVEAVRLLVERDRAA